MNTDGPCYCNNPPITNASPTLLPIQMPPGNDASMILLDILKADALAPDKQKNLVCAPQDLKHALFNAASFSPCYAALPVRAKNTEVCNGYNTAYHLACVS